MVLLKECVGGDSVRSSWSPSLTLKAHKGLQTEGIQELGNTSLLSPTGFTGDTQSFAHFPNRRMLSVTKSSKEVVQRYILNTAGI